MPSKSQLKVTALVRMVGITGLNPQDTGWPAGRGLSQKTIGTDPRYDTSFYVPTAMLHDNEHRLVNELRALWNASKIAIEIDGEAITSITQLTELGEPSGLMRKGEMFILPHTLYQAISGTWTEFFDDVANRWRLVRDANAADEVLAIVIPAHYLTGADGSTRRARGIRLYYSVATADLDDLTIEAYLHTPPANGSQIAAGSAIHTSGSYDTSHDTAPERGLDTANPQYHTLEYTFSTDVVDWLASGEAITILVNVAAAGAGAAVFTYWGISFLYWDRPGPGMDD